MIYLKTKEEIELIRKNCLIVSGALTEVGKALRPGITGVEIDQIAETYIRDCGAEPGFKGYGGFPTTLCISVNHCVVHGIPNDEEFVNGDIVSVDCGSLMNGYYGDAAFTFGIGEIKPEVERLMTATNESLYRAIEAAQIGNRIGDIGHAVQDYCEREQGFSVVRELVGHGVGKNLHESPEVPNYGKKGRGPKLKNGLVIAIEPMINLGKKDIRQDADGWSIVTRDKLPSAHYEHTIAITENGPDILSDHSGVAEAVKNNGELANISVKNRIFALRNFVNG